jgi:hypothetical protein
VGTGTPARAVCGNPCIRSLCFPSSCIALISLQWSTHSPTKSVTGLERSIAASEVFQLHVRKPITSLSRESDILKTSTMRLSPATRPPQLSPIATLPQELLDKTISYLVYNTDALLACSLTCYWWYIATLRHLHRSLATDDQLFSKGVNRYQWPTPLRQSHDLGLLPLVERFRIRLTFCGEFTPKRLRGYDLHCFSALTNLQELGIDHLQISSFMPNLRQCFGHFAPTLRFLALKKPRGSSRQILYFIGLFPKLQNLKLFYSFPEQDPESTADAELVPLSVPPLRGRLTLTCLAGERLVKDMMAVFGGLRFRSMDLFRVRCTQLLLGACAETLETLWLYPTDVDGKDSLKRRSRTLAQILVSTRTF